MLILRQARRDLENAHNWYERQQPGLGADFLDDIEAPCERIIGRPSRYPEVSNNVRRALTHSFPYAIYFRSVADEIRVIAVLHQRRGPAALRRRIR
jgi:plasmid stabilization system protein ParE